MGMLFTKYLPVWTDEMKASLFFGLKNFEIIIKSGIESAWGMIRQKFKLHEWTETLSLNVKAMKQKFIIEKRH